MSNGGALSHPRSTTSTALWAHLLRKDLTAVVPPSNPKQHVVPVAPIDKAGTSMRLLLHDTQANLEKFSERVDKLTGGVQETRREVDLVKRLWEGERDKSHAEIADLGQSNRLKRWYMRVIPKLLTRSNSEQMSNFNPKIPGDSSSISRPRISSKRNIS
jgi:hypothetical protein